jgi:hypothetical protein
LDARLVSEMLNGAYEIEVFDFLHKLKNIPRRTTSKTLVTAGFLADVK